MYRLDENGCQTRVYGSRDVFGYQCKNKPVVERNGKLYCRIHDPIYIEAKRKKREAQWDREWIENQKRNVLRRARMQATEGLTLQELQQVSPDLIRRALQSYDEHT